MADDVCRPEAERVQQAQRVSGEQLGRVAARRGRGRAGPAVVEGDDRVARGERLDEVGMPRSARIAGAGDQEKGNTRAAALVRDCVTSDVDGAALARDWRAYRLGRAHLIRGKL